MFEVGRVCMKIAGRDAGKKCLIIDVIDEHFVMIDGQTRRRKCNIKHLEPLNQVLQVTKNAPAPEITRVLKEMGILVDEKKPKAKTERPKKTRKKKEKPVKDKAAKADTKAKKAGKNKAEEKAEVKEKPAQEKTA